MSSILKTHKLCLLAPDQSASKRQGRAVLPGMPDLKPLILTSEAKLFPSPFQAAYFSQPVGHVVHAYRCSPQSSGSHGLKGACRSTANSLFSAHTKFTGPLITPNKPFCFQAAIRCHFSYQNTLIMLRTSHRNTYLTWTFCIGRTRKGQWCLFLPPVERWALIMTGDISVWKSVAPSDF